MNEERLTIEEQLEEIKDCGSKFNDVQYYCLYKYDIERIIPYIEDLQQRINNSKRISLQLRTHLSNWLFKNGYLGGERTEKLLDELDEILGDEK